MPSRRQIFVLLSALSLGCSQEGNMSTDEREGRARIEAYLKSPEYKKAVDDRLALMEKEEEVREEAGWIGKTGLSEDLERELPRYLRRELGQSLFDSGSIKAGDLAYVGRFLEGGKTIHYWRVPYNRTSDVYAYVELSPSGDSLIGWGDKKPPT